MNANYYQAVTLTTAVYPDAGRGTMAAISYCALGLGEIGEVQGKLKKVLRGDVTLAAQQDAIIDELGDVLWYVARLTDELGFDLSTVMTRNLNKLAERKARGTVRGTGDDR